MKITHKLRNLAMTGMLLAGIGAAPNASALTELSLLVDGSGSIGSGNFATFKTGIANAVATINTDSTVSVQVVRFASSASTIVSSTLIDSQATLDAVVAAISGMGYTRGLTCYSCAFNAATAGLGFGADDTTLVNMMTDGSPTTGGSGVAQRNGLIAAGADIISFEAVNLGAGTTAFLRDDLAYPQPGVVAPPYPDPITSNGWVTPVTGFADIETALKQKFIAGGIAPPTNVPEPGSLLLLGLGMAGLAGMRKKRAS